jgi:hypothetical protein
MSEFLADYQEVEVFAEELGRHPRTIKRWMDEPDGLPSVKVGNLTLIHIPTARQWLLSRMRHPNPTRGAIERSERRQEASRHGGSPAQADARALVRLTKRIRPPLSGQP